MLTQKSWFEGARTTTKSDLPVSACMVKVTRRPAASHVAMPAALTNCIFLFATAVLAASALAIGDVPLLAAYFSTPRKTVPVAEYAGSLSRNLFAVNRSSKNRGSISVYDIDAGHRLVKTRRCQRCSRQFDNRQGLRRLQR